MQEKYFRKTHTRNKKKLVLDKTMFSLIYFSRREELLFSCSAVSDPL